MTDILYALIAIICAVVLEILLNRTISMKGGDDSGKLFTWLLFVSFIFCFVDTFWGFIASHTLKWGTAALIIVSFMFHFMAAASSLTWTIYVDRYLPGDSRKIQKAFGLVLFTAQIVLLIVNFDTGIIFYVDEIGEYRAGEYRTVMFILQGLNYLYAMFRTLIEYFRIKDKFRKKRCLSVAVFAVVPIILGVFQWMYPYAPFYSIGFMLASTVIFIYNITSEHEHMLELENQMTKMVSRQNRDTINALAKIFSFMAVVDLAMNRIRIVQHESNHDEYLDENDDVQTRLERMIIGLVDEKFIDATLDFVNLKTLPRRLTGKTSIAHEYLNSRVGWCRAYFIKMNTDENGAVQEVVYAIEQIDEEKRREIEYQQALAKALENQNEVFAEMLQMQSNGIIATDMDNKIIKMNDAAAKMFGYPSSDSFDGNIRTLIDKCETERKDMLISSFTALKTIGGRISYEFGICNDGLNHIYVMATSNLAVMTSGEKFIITSMTNVTKSKMLEHELTQMSETDALTGIRNRGSGEKRISDMLLNGTAGMFALMDVDKFKTINDTFGHGVGDKVLIAMSKCLSKSFRGVDIVMRLGGDEFAVYAVGVTKPETAKMCINRLFDEINYIDIEEMRESGRKVTISLGAVICTDDNMKSFDEVYQMADAQLYESKKVEGNHFGMA